MIAKPFALAVSFVVAGTASAGFVGITFEEFTGDGWIENGYTGLVAFRLYAEFDGKGDDGVLSVFGADGLPLSMESLGDGLFHNDPMFDSLTAPEDLTGPGIWSNQWDTYVTIGATEALGDATTTSNGFASETNNLASDWVTENAAWAVGLDDDQSKAVDNRVLLGQFVVADDGAPLPHGVFGVFNGLTREGEKWTDVGGQPAPGALALLALAGMARTRRRRR